MNSTHTTDTRAGPLILPATDHPVTHVTVYRDRAEVARKLAAVSIKRTSPTTIQLRGLPRSLDTNSVRVEPLTNSARVLIADVQVADQLERVEKKPEEEAAAEDDAWRKRRPRPAWLIKQYADARASTVKLDSGADLVKDFVAGFVPSHEHVGKDLTLRKVQLDEQVKDAEANVADLDDWVRSHEYLVQRKDDEAEYEMVMSVFVTLEVPEKASSEGDAESIETDLLVSYVVPNARWSPHYDLRVYSRDNLAHLTYNANLRQWTGEDWTKAQLVLSTASIASIGHDLPKFTSRWELREKAPPLLMRKMSPMKRSGAPPPPPPPAPGGTVAMMAVCEEGLAPLAASAMVALPPPAPKPVISAPKAEVLAEDTGLTAAAFKIAMPTTVPSDNVDHRVAIAVLQLPVSFARVAVPRLAPGKVFLEGTVTNESDYVLVPGEARVGIDGSFVGKSALDLVMPKATFKLNLGLDPTIEITLKPTQKQTELGKPKPTGALALFAGSGNVASPSTVPAVAAVMTPGCKVVMHTNRIVIANKAGGNDGGNAQSAAAPARIRVSDQIPTAQHADIHIVLVDPDLSKGSGVAVHVKASRNAAADEAATGAGTSVAAQAAASGGSMGSLKRAKSSSAAKLPAAVAAASITGGGRLPVFYKDVGELEWDVDVDAGKSTEIVCKYALVYPKDFKVEGLTSK
ncbi:hypothetical protein BCR44DRAFT_1535752 [Catenaria anguillulae PL171]|uniref:DUF4139 domain-containing protein n=1 Tax=Catenaria anguillulae PL171 TaxID=765915 RepID=A0A1Y2HGU0_9FUNG|nr:hypothetical protein BCR44DRAFT_1535752 [Catenaria anguillulae PL171]